MSRGSVCKLFNVDTNQNAIVIYEKVAMAASLGFLLKPTMVGLRDVAQWSAVSLSDFEYCCKLLLCSTDTNLVVFHSHEAISPTFPSKYHLPYLTVISIPNRFNIPFCVSFLNTLSYLSTNNSPAHISR